MCIYRGGERERAARPLDRLPITKKLTHWRIYPSKLSIDTSIVLLIYLLIQAFSLFPSCFLPRLSFLTIDCTHPLLAFFRYIKVNTPHYAVGSARDIWRGQDCFGCLAVFQKDVDGAWNSLIYFPMIYFFSKCMIARTKPSQQHGLQTIHFQNWTSISLILCSLLGHTKLVNK